MDPKQVLEFAKKNNAVMVDLKFMDFPGMWQHFSVPLHELEEDSFEGRIRIRRIFHFVVGSRLMLPTCWLFPIRQPR